MIYRFYKLIDPVDNSIRYVGITTQTLKKRLSGHIKDCRRQEGEVPTPKNLWLQELVQGYSEPIIELLEEVTYPTTTEEQWIYYHWQQGHPLTNTIYSDKFIIALLRADTSIDVFNGNILRSLDTLRLWLRLYHEPWDEEDGDMNESEEDYFDYAASGIHGMLTYVRMKDYTRFWKSCILQVIQSEIFLESTQQLLLSLLEDKSLYEQFRNGGS